MLNISQLPLNSTVTFDFYPSQVLGTGVKRAKVLAILDAATAAVWIDPIALHANVFPFLPVGTPNSFDAYPYVKLKLQSGEITFVGLPWIREETLVLSTTQKMQLTIDSVTPEDQDRIIKALSANGFKSLDVKLLD